MGVERDAEGSAVGVGQGLLQRDVAWGVVEVLLRAEHVGHTHCFVVDDDGEVVRGEAVGLADDEIVHLAGGVADVAEDFVVDDDLLVGGGEADDVALAGLGTLPALLHDGRVLAELDVGGARVAVGLLRGDGGGALLLGFLVGVEGRVGAAAGDEALEIRVVDRDAAGLEVLTNGRAAARGFPIVLADGAVGVHVGAEVVDDAEPLEVLDDAAGGLEAAAGGVGVLDAEHEAAALLFGEGPAEESGAGAADVEVSGGRGGEAGDEGGHGRQGYAATSSRSFE